MPKVYLSKSNTADPALVESTRSLLRKMDCEILEFMGGKYSNADDRVLQSADALLIVPPLSQLEEDQYVYSVGRGQWDQILKFSNNNADYDDIYIVNSTNTANNTIVLHKLFHMHSQYKPHQQSYAKWGKIEVELSHDVFDEQIEEYNFEDIGLKLRSDFKNVQQRTASLFVDNDKYTGITFSTQPYRLTNINKVQPILAASLMV